MIDSRSKYILYGLPWFFLAILWVAWIIVSPRLISQVIEDAYHGRGPSIFNKIIAEDRQVHEADKPRPLSFYLDYWNHTLKRVISLVFLLGGVFICVASNILLSVQFPITREFRGERQYGQANFPDYGVGSDMHAWDFFPAAADGNGLYL